MEFLLGPPEARVSQDAIPLQLLQLDKTRRPRTVHLGSVEVTAIAVVAGIRSQFVQAPQRGHRPDCSPHIARRHLRVWRGQSPARAPTAICPRAVSSSCRAVISLHEPRPALSGGAFRCRRAPMDWPTWRSPRARCSSPRRRAAGRDCLPVLISSSSLARSICLGPSAGRSTQASSRASQPARLPRTAGRGRSARPMFQMPPRTGGGGVPAPQAPPPTALPRRRVARSVILRAWTRTGDPRPRASPLTDRTAAAGPGSASGWRFRPWLTSFRPPGLHRRGVFALPLSLRGNGRPCAPKAVSNSQCTMNS
jgi:hypothetical protein